MGLLTILVGALIVTACGGGSESGATGVAVADGTRIAFASDRDGDFEIYTMRPDGTDVRQLTANDAVEYSPAWSPDGTRIAFVSLRDGNYEIYTMRPDGRDVRHAQTRLRGLRQPAWSPDGTRIAFSSNHSGDWEIYTMRPDGTDVRQLTGNARADGEPTWSPGGTRIAFISQSAGDDSEIYTISSRASSMRPSGTDVRQLTVNEKHEVNPAWSPDGTWIAFTYDRNSIHAEGDGDWEIYTMRSNGTDVRQLTASDGWSINPAWSSDGTRIAFASDRDGDWQIYTMRPDGTDVRQLTASDAEDGQPAWSP